MRESIRPVNLVYLLHKLNLFRDNLLSAEDQNRMDFVDILHELDFPSTF